MKGVKIKIVQHIEILNNFDVFQLGNKIGNIGTIKMKNIMVIFA